MANFEPHRRPDYSIDLAAAWRAENDGKDNGPAEKYLELVESYHPVHSRQAAAIAMATADYISIV